ncbi:MAG: hypothetical protein UV73_C0007G0053 [Candidatus Gottesmanbacteria bacterium GW2011_GWA2_43_14]|uniref:Aminotransferase class I/classII large domain-containing protein n=1 Tax=Candidatus Gottesmanbacteria bacterium GW2011_GWA2_43_14 TaxID=1618443 RepID=A0A0G1DIG5_9BACT|nr:MAG: hypothetical protein UV73_C0007G0053 [Candidatus Gottesmanbacteria bacterium GW2011_GWA2_43_14]
MVPEIPKAIYEAITIAPIDPMGKDFDPKGEKNSFNGFVKKEIEGLKREDSVFDSQFKEMLNGMTYEQQEAFIFYLTITSRELVDGLESMGMPFTDEEKTQAVSTAARTLFEFIKRPEIESETTATDRTWRLMNRGAYTPDKKPEMSATTAVKMTSTSAVEEEITDKNILLAKKLHEMGSDFKTLLKSEKRPAEIREWINIRKAAINFCEKNGIDPESLKDFIIGNISLKGDMEPQYHDVPERMGFRGAKRKRIDRRADAYMEILEKTDMNPTGYQALGIGWQGLIDRHIGYLNRYNLNGYIPERGAFVSYGATDGIARAYMLARYTLHQELYGNTPRKYEYSPKILFPTPGFTMLGKLPRELGMQTVEMVTAKEYNFFLNPQKLKEFLEKDENQDVLIVDLSIINNPSSTIVPPEQLRQVLEVLENHRGRNDAKVIVINDCAYLGMGSQEQLKKTGAIINSFKRRIDVLPMTKIFGRPSLRSGFVGTPDETLARHIPAITKLLTPSVSYAMMAEAMAIWDYVSFEDQLRYFDMLHHRQKKLLEILSVRPDIFNLDEYILSGKEDDKEMQEINGVLKKSEDDLAAFYVYVQIQDGVDPLDIPFRTRFYVNNEGTFYLNCKRKGPKYVRFALGVESLSDEKVEKIKKELIHWKKVTDSVSFSLN